jgi:hypothetical protein
MLFNLNMRKTTVFIAIASLMVLGAGCGWFKDNVANRLPDMRPSGPRPADLENIDSAEAAKRINFVVGSQIEMVQASSATSTEAANKADDGNKEGVRIITIERFAPLVYAQLSWKLGHKVNGQMESAIGALEGVNLQDSHSLYPPAYWPPEKTDAKSTSAIWLSQPVFEELSKTKNSTLFFGFTDGSLCGHMKTSKVFMDAVVRLRGEAEKVDTKTDADLTKAEAELADWPLKVNDKVVTVQVIKAHDWYGDIVVLNNPQNPLILKMSFNPSPDVLKAVSADGFLQSLLGYEVTALNGVQ